MKETILFKENRLSLGITIIIGLFTLLMASLLIIQIVSGPIGTKPAPTWVLAVITGICFLFAINFSVFRIQLTDKCIKVSHGIIGTSRKWNDLRACELDKKNYFYGGWGIRFGRYEGEWVWVYNVIGGSRVIFFRKSGKKKTLIVSTKNPDEVIRIANEQIAKTAS